MNKKIVFSLSLTTCMLNGMQDPYGLIMQEHSSALNATQPSMTLHAGDDDESKQLAQMVTGQLALSDRTLAERVKKAFVDRAGHNATRPTIAVETLRDLHVLSGSQEHPTRCIILKIPTQTTAGRLRLAKKMVCPATTQQVHQWQDLVRLFVNNSSVTRALRSQIALIGPAERSLFSLWAAYQPGTNDPLEHYVNNRIPSVGGSYEAGLVNAEGTVFYDQGYFVQAYGWFVDKFTTGNYKNNDAYISAVRSLLEKKIRDLLTFFEAIKVINRLLKIGRTAHSANAQGYWAAQFNPADRSTLSSILSSQNAATIETLNSELNDQTTSPITKLGALFRIYMTLYAMKSDLLTAYHIIGKLDAALSLAQLVITLPQRYSLPSFTTSTALELSDYWNMLVDDNDLMLNSISLGVNDPRIVIVTGTNGGGKTTAIKAIGQCEFLAKLGVVPARSCNLALPNQVITGIYIVDRAAAQNDGGASLFQAQVGRLGAIKRAAEAEQGLTVIIVDEPAKGSREQLANRAVNQFLQGLRALDARVLCFMTTHLSGPVSTAEAAPQHYRLMYGHSDHKVDGNAEGALDDDAALDIIAAAMGGDFGLGVRNTMLNAQSGVL